MDTDHGPYGDPYGDLFPELSRVPILAKRKRNLEPDEENEENQLNAKKKTSRSYFLTLSRCII